VGGYVRDQAQSTKYSKQRWICWGGVFLLLAFSLARFASDGMRLTYPANDLTPVWVSSKAFLAGHDPYRDINYLTKIWEANRPATAQGCDRDYSCLLKNLPMGYPPITLPILSALTVLPWNVAMWSYLAVSSALFIFMLLMLAQKLEVPWSDPRKWYIVACGMAMAPLHAGIHMSNLSTIMIGILCLGVISMHENPYGAGIALAISFCLKPQVAFIFFAYPWLRKQWKTAFTALTVVAAILTGTWLWMDIHQINVFGSYMSALVQFNSPESYNSFTFPGPIRYLLINLQVLVYQFTPSKAASNIISWSIFAFLAIVSTLIIYLRVPEKDDDVTIAVISVLTMLPVYQHTYSAALLIFVVYWAIKNWHLVKAKAALLLMFPLLFPIVAMTIRYHPLAEFVVRHRLGSHFCWNAFFMPHVVWIEIILMLILLADLFRYCRLSQGAASTMRSANNAV
jgi:hypothetical protein